MNDRFSLKEFQRSVNRFRDYGSRLCSSDRTNFDSALHLFVDFCETDPIISILTERLKNNPTVAFQEWYRNSLQPHQRLRRIYLPPDLDRRLPILYLLLLELRQQDMKAQSIVSSLILEKTIEENIRKFNAMLAAEFINDFIHELDELKDSLEKEPEQKEKDFDTSMLMRN